MSNYSFEEIINNQNNSEIKIYSSAEKLILKNQKKQKIKVPLIYTIDIYTRVLTIYKGQNSDVLADIQKNHFLNDLPIFKIINKSVDISEEISKRVEELVKKKINNILKDKSNNNLRPI